MTTNVTVAASASTSVLIPFSSAANAAQAQAALDQINPLVGGVGIGVFSPVNTAGSPTLPNPLLAGLVIDTVPASQNLGILSSKYEILVNAGSGLVAAIGGPNTTVVSGQSAKTIYVNQAVGGEAFFGGGQGVVSNAFSISTLTVNADGGSGNFLGSGTMIVDATNGSTTVNAFANVLLDVIAGGGSADIVTQAGTEAVEVTGSTTVPVTVTGQSGSTIWYLSEGSAGGGLGFIQPNGADVVVLPGGASSETLFGGANQATVAGGIGMFTGGTGGGNLLQSGTVAATTLIGGGNGDVLFVSGVGQTIQTGNGTGVIATAAAVTVGGGDNYTTGTGTGTIFGAQDGGDTYNIGGNGTYELAIFHGTGLATTGTQNTTVLGGGNTVQELAAGAGAKISIADWEAGQISAGGTIAVDEFLLNGVTANLAASAGNTVATLSDGTVVTFLNASVHNVGTAII
jgi:hypothetical protein